MKRFEHKRVLVTGAARNTGRGIARRFAEEGAVVIMNGRTGNIKKVRMQYAGRPAHVL